MSRAILMSKRKLRQLLSKCIDAHFWSFCSTRDWQIISANTKYSDNIIDNYVEIREFCTVLIIHNMLRNTQYWWKIMRINLSSCRTWYYNRHVLIMQKKKQARTKNKLSILSIRLRSFFLNSGCKFESAIIIYFYENAWCIRHAHCTVVHSIHSCVFL